MAADVIKPAATAFTLFQIRKLKPGWVAGVIQDGPGLSQPPRGIAGHREEEATGPTLHV